MLDSELLSPVEVHARWRGCISIKTLSNWRHDEAGSGPPFVRFGSRIFYPLDGLLGWEKARTYTTTKDYGKRKVP
jgi:hypothetical protein